MASPPVLSPSGTTGFNIEVWQRTVEAATYQKMKFIPIIDEGDRPLNLLHIRKHARVSSSVLAQGDDGDGLTAVNITGTPVTVTPAGNFVMVEWSENLEAQVELNLDSEAQGNIEMALAEGTDQSALTNVQSLTKFSSVAAVDGPAFRNAYGQLMGNTNGLAEPGAAPQVHAIFSHTQYPALGVIPEFNNAEIRGDGESPFVKGIWMRGGGVLLHMTTVVAQDANGWHNCVFIPAAFVVAWNVRSRIKRQDDELLNRVIVYNNLGTAVQHDLRAFAIRTTSSQLT